MKKFINGLGVCAILVASMANAQQSGGREFAEIYTECGLGGMIAPSSDAVAAVTNVTWDSGTTAISSNASSPETCSGGKEKAASYIHESYDMLETDLAAGNGEYLDNLLAVAGCGKAARPEIAGALRDDFGRLVSASSYDSQSRFEKSKGMYDALIGRIDQNFAGVCSIG